MSPVGRCAAPISTSNRSETDATARTSEEEAMLVRMLDKVLRRSDVVDKEALCVQASERVSARTRRGIGSDGTSRFGTYD